VSAETVDIARRAYEAFNGGGVEAILDFLDPEIEWRMFERFARDPRVYQGHAGVREVLGLFEENFDAFGAAPHEFIDADDRIVVPVRLYGSAKGTGEETSFELVHVWTARDGRASKLDVYSTREEALRAVGLSTS
jgi:ketosteroid isomerase-like protein